MSIVFMRFLFLGLFSFLITVPSWLRNETHTAVKKHVIFDLGGVLFETDTKKAIRELGLTNIIRYWFTTGKPENIKKVLFHTFDLIQPTGNDCDAYDPSGEPLPGLMCDWLKGTKTNKELRDLVLPAIKETKQWFANGTEQQMVYNIARMMFSPKRFCDSFKLVPEGFNFVTECKEKGHAVYVLSNFDDESFKLVEEKYPELFGLFDGIVVSGKEKLIKPMPEIYELFTQKLPAQDCIFIDDQKENIEAAQQCGIHAIHCRKQAPGFLGIGSKPDFAAVRKEFADIERAGYALPQSVYLATN